MHVFCVLAAQSIPADTAQQHTVDLWGNLMLQELQIRSSYAESSLSVPIEASSLQELTCLHLNGFADSFDSICHWTRLHKLVLRGYAGSRPHVMPCNVVQLTGLTKVRLDLLPCTGALGSMSALQALKHLCILQPVHSAAVDSAAQDAAALAFSHALACLSNIHRLATANLRIDLSAAGGLAHMAGMTRLQLSAAELQEFDCCSTWPKLQELLLPHNRLRHLPMHLQRLTSLHILDLSFQAVAMAIREPLDFLGQMPQLRSVSLLQAAWSPKSLAFLASAKLQHSNCNMFY